MVGTPSFLLETAPVLFGLLFALGGLTVAVRGKRRQGLALFVVGALFGGLLGARYFHQWRTHRYLTNLDPASVRAITVGHARIDDAEHLRAIVGALRAGRWFSPNHGGWSTELPLVIASTPAAPVRLRVALYTRAEGAVLSLSRGGGWSDGYVFSPDLPRVLAEAGAPLPGRRWQPQLAAEGWSVEIDLDSVTTGADAVRRAWVRLRMGTWIGVTRIHVECAAARIRYEAFPGIPTAWTQGAFEIRPGSVSAGLRAALCD